MQRNVEIKARIREDFNTFVVKVKELSNSEGSLLRQEDIFFNSPNGRLKLRQIQVMSKCILIVSMFQCCRLRMLPASLLGARMITYPL